MLLDLRSQDQPEPTPTTFGPGNLLRSTGIRRPWMPAPLADLTVAMARAVVVATVVAAVLPPPAAPVWMPRPIGDAPPPDRLSPPAVVVSQPPLPSSSTYTTYAPRAPNTDPLRPTLILTEPPDASLAQPSTTWIGQLPRPEDVNWPARPALMQGVPAPVPGAQAQLLAPPRPENTDPLRPTRTLVGAQPMPGASMWAPSAARLPNSDPLRPVAIVAEVPDPTLQQPALIWTSRLPRDEDTTRPARPALVVLGQQPQSLGQALATYAPRDQVAAPPDRLAFTATLVGQQPMPQSSVWAPSAARLPNSDPLHPPIVVAEPPDATLVQGAAISIGRLPRPEDRAWPARPATIVCVPVPIPGAVLWEPQPPRAANTDPLRPITMVVEPVDGSIVQASAQLVGRLSRSEDTTRPARWTLVTPGSQPTPGALALVTFAPRDQAAAQPDRARPAAVIVSQQPSPAGLALATVAPRPANTDPLRPPLASVGQQPVPGGQALTVGYPHDADRLARPIVTTGQQPIPAGHALMARPIGVETAPPQRLSVLFVPVAPTPLAFRAGQVRWARMLGDPEAITSPVPLTGRRSARLHGERDRDLSGARDAELHGERDTDLTGRRGRNLTKR